MSGNTVYVINKGNEKVTLPDKISATELVLSLTILGCCDPITNQVISGNRQDHDLYEVCFLDKHVKVINQLDAEMILCWMLNYGCQKVSIEKLNTESETV